MSFDLARLDTRAAADEGVWFDLEDMDGKPMKDDAGEPIQFKLAGRDSAIAKEAIRSMGDMDGLSEDERIQHRLSAFVLDWSKNVEMGGKKMKVTPENKLAAVSIPHIGDWVTRKAAERAAFTTPL